MVKVPTAEEIRVDSPEMMIEHEYCNFMKCWMVAAKLYKIIDGLLNS